MLSEKMVKLLNDNKVVIYNDHLFWTKPSGDVREFAYPISEQEDEVIRRAFDIESKLANLLGRMKYPKKVEDYFDGIIEGLFLNRMAVDSILVSLGRPDLFAFRSLDKAVADDTYKVDLSYVDDETYKQVAESLHETNPNRVCLTTADCQKAAG